MDISEAILSDALVGLDSDGIGTRVGEKDYEIVRTRFEFWNPLEEAECSTSSDEDDHKSKFDGNGDLKVRRRPKCRDYLIIEHTMATTLADVGLQIWHGALLLCDYVLFRSEEIHQKSVVELGCGAGLTAICGAVAGAKAVYATDHDRNALQLTRRNVESNGHLIPNQGRAVETVRLDWRDPMSTSEWQCLDSCQIILAADVIYDIDLNAALFAVIERLCENSPKIILISLEKRYNFTISEMDVACPQYAHFLEWIENMKRKNWVIMKISNEDIPICFNYTRSSDLELWRISTA